MENLLNVISKFKLPKGEVKDLAPYGEGHINSTYKFSVGNKDYILQKINSTIFKDVEGLMNNISLVTESLRKIIEENNGNPDRETMTIIKTLDDKLYYFDEPNNGYYRIYDFVTDSVTIQNCTNKEDFKKSAEGFSKFAKQLEKLDASKLCEVIPNFHNSEMRFEHFKKTLSIDKVNRAKTCKEEIEFFLKRENDYKIVVNLIKEGKMPLRVTHNDTKLNNILFDKDTMQPLCVIDLDTIMPGSVLYDFGDSIRFGCNPCSENEKDLSKVNFLMDYFESYVEGYLKYLGSSLNEYEIKYLAFGAKLMTLECGTRFLDDYLDGDNYFRIHYEDENLDRARTQIKLVKDMENVMDKLNEIVLKYSN